MAQGYDIDTVSVKMTVAPTTVVTVPGSDSDSDSYTKTETDELLRNKESISNKTNIVDEYSDDNHYPTAGAVYRAGMDMVADVMDHSYSKGFINDFYYTSADVDGKLDGVKSITDGLKSDIEGIQNRINTEAHFKGYMSTNAKIQALEATPNDFAYSAESGTKWIYDENNGWQDSGTPVPDQLTPASDAAPLMDGVASAGTDGTYARGDHRHPTDTSRASVEYVNELLGRYYTQEQIDVMYGGINSALNEIIALQVAKGGDAV